MSPFHLASHAWAHVPRWLWPVSTVQWVCSTSATVQLNQGPLTALWAWTDLEWKVKWMLAMASYPWITQLRCSKKFLSSHGLPCCTYNAGTLKYHSPQSESKVLWHAGPVPYVFSWECQSLWYLSTSCPFEQSVSRKEGSISLNFRLLKAV